MFKKMRPASPVPSAAPKSPAEYHLIGDALRILPRGELEAYVSERTRFAYLGNNRGIAVMLGHYKMHLDTTDQGFAPHMIFDGYWEYWLTKFLADQIKPGDVACDVGSNLGYYSILMSELVGSAGHVHCFEPNPKICSLLRGSLALNGFARRTTVHQVAVSDEARPDVSFFIPHGEPKNGTMVPAGFSHASGETIVVRSQRFDSIKFDRLDFVKIDVEGAELGVLRALQSLKERFHPKIVSEVNFGRKYGYQDILALLGHDGQLQHIDYDGTPKALTPEMAQNQRVNEDWLVYSPGQ
jgi:FkbM family methyltransferase